MINAAGGYVSAMPRRRCARRSTATGGCRPRGSTWASTWRRWTGPMPPSGCGATCWRKARPDAPWVAADPVRDRGSGGARRGALRAAAAGPPPWPKGPSAGDVEAAEDMDPEARQRDDPGHGRAAVGPPGDRGRHRRGLGAADQRLRRSGRDRHKPRRIWAEAQSVFADSPERLATVRAAAEARAWPSDLRRDQRFRRGAAARGR